MKLLFLARHDSGDNDDEGAVAHAFRVLGHTVVRVQERRKHRSQAWPDVLRLADACDWCLCFKHPVVSELQDLSRHTKLAFWHFDLIDGTFDPTLAERSRSRIRWMDDVVPLCRVGFCTDGSWVARWNADRQRNGLPVAELVHLPQGADERVTGPGKPTHLVTPVLFTGMVQHGQDRAAHVRHLKETFNGQFAVFGDSQRDRLHGRDLADLVASTQILIAPDGPGNDLYWSNRVYLTTGFRGFLLHPYASRLARDYLPGDHMQFYVSREHLDQLVRYYLDRPDKARELAEAGYKRCLEANLYRHRVEKMVTIFEGLS